MTPILHKIRFLNLLSYIYKYNSNYLKARFTHFIHNIKCRITLCEVGWQWQMYIQWVNMGWSVKNT